MISPIVLVALLAAALAAIRQRLPQKPGTVLDVLVLLWLVLPWVDLQRCFKGLPLFLMLLTWFIFSALPVFYITFRLAALRIKSQWVEVAKVQGLGCWGIFWNLYLPQNWLLILGGLVLGFLRGYFTDRIVTTDPCYLFSIAALFVYAAIAAAVIVLLLRLGKHQA